jgi:hypothetical protein
MARLMKRVDISMVVLTGAFLAPVVGSISGATADR